MNITTKLFPTILIILDVLASFVYAFEPDWRRAIYWLSAAVLTMSVTY